MSYQNNNIKKSMKRRDFINVVAPITLGVSAFPGALFAKNSSGVVTAEDLNRYLRSLVEVNEPSVDKVIVGDPDTKISKIGTAWMPYWSTLKEARSLGVNTLVVHEPTFYTHRDLEETTNDYLSAPSPAKELYAEQVAYKKKWIEEEGYWENDKLKKDNKIIEDWVPDIA